MTKKLSLLRHNLEQESVFTAESLVSAVRADRKLEQRPTPPLCVLEFDGDLTDWLVESGVASPFPLWPCFHTTMYSIEIEGNSCGIIPRTIGGPYAVLVAEQLRACGTKVILGLTSAGRVSGPLPLPSIVIATAAIRDEGTSYHYLEPEEIVEGNSALSKELEKELRELPLPVSSGLVWTTDAPYRETREELLRHENEGVLAVEMQAASLFAFGQAQKIKTGVVALVTNGVDHEVDPFDKGSYEKSADILMAMCRAALKLCN